LIRLSTAQKTKIATLLSSAIRGTRELTGLSATVEVIRRGIRWRLDLREGIDFAIYLLGAFEPATQRCYRERVTEGSVAIDIGANIGAHTLPLAQVVGASGRVIAFEPTSFAFEKLLTNISLNHSLHGRITPLQAMLVDSPGTAVSDALHASWPVDGSADVHPVLRGRLMQTVGATALTLDDALKARKIDRADFIKMDVDGNEVKVLKGAHETLSRFKPAILMELAPYVFTTDREFEHLLRVLWDYGYALEDIGTRRRLPQSAAAVRRIRPAADQRVGEPASMKAAPGVRSRHLWPPGSPSARSSSPSSSTWTGASSPALWKA
jgi:FkbM family methyltransferase